MLNNSKVFLVSSPMPSDVSTNGTILTKLSRKVQPQPRELDGQYDYLAPENGGILKPGILLECGGYLDINNYGPGVVMSNSGIKVKNIRGRRASEIAETNTNLNEARRDLDLANVKVEMLTRPTHIRHVWQLSVKYYPNTESRQQSIR